MIIVIFIFIVIDIVINIMIIMIIIIIENNLRSSIVCRLFSGGIKISSGLFVFSFSFAFVLPAEVISSTILFPIKSPVASAIFEQIF